MRLDGVAATVQPKPNPLAFGIEEGLVESCIKMLNRVLRPIDDPLFYYIVDQLLADQPEIVRHEVQSRLYQLIPPDIARQESPGSQAWLMH
jgi:hypothetical protein